MKKRFLPLLLSILLLLQMVPAASAATTSKNVMISFYSFASEDRTGASELKSYYFLSISDALNALAAGQFQRKDITPAITYYLDSTKPYEIKINTSEKLTETVDKKVIISKPTESDGSKAAEDTDTIVIQNSDTVTIAISSTKSKAENQLTFSKGLEVQNGATLILANHVSNKASTIHYTFNDDVTVSGVLEFAAKGNTNAKDGPVTFTNSATLNVTEGGHAIIGRVKLTGNTSDPLIKVANGGELTFMASGSFPGSIQATGTAIQNSGTLNLDSGSITTTGTNTPVIVSNGGEVKLEKTQENSDKTGNLIPVISIAAPSAAPAIKISGGSLTVAAGKVTSNSNEQPAIVVESGNVTITKEDKYKGNNTTGIILTPTITSACTEAVDLHAGVTVTNAANVSATVSDKNEGDNYVDNDGNIILAAGAKAGNTESMNAAVILSNGTIIEGSKDKAPEIKTETDDNGNVTTTVTIPPEGSITALDGEKQELTNGGTATTTVTTEGGTTTTVTTVTVVTLGKTSLSLTVGGTETLTATVEPADDSKTVTWSSSNTNVATVDETGKVTAVAAGTATITAKVGTDNSAPSATCAVTVTKPSSGSSGSGSSSTTTQTTTNPDGSTTTTVTNKKTGTVTETTKYKDGSTLAVETKKDGTVTTTATAVNGVKTVTVEKPGEKVTAAITLPAGVDSATVTIPADLTPGTVAVDTKTGEIVRLSVPTEDGMLIKVEDSAKLVLEDRSKDFIDTPGHWGEDAIDFAVAHEMFNGTSETTFTPDGDMTRAMLMTVLARFDGQDTTGGETWYEKGMEWAKANSVSDGTDPNAPITREQLVTMLYRYAGSPAADGSLASFTDAGKVSAYAADAMGWAVGTGILNGMGDGTLAPQAPATRAQVATILMRFCENVAK